MTKAFFRLLRNLLTALVPVCSSGCIPVLTDGPESGNVGNPVRVSFDIRTESSLKSSISPEESAVHEISLYAFCDGVLASCGHFDADQCPELQLLLGHTYNVYALANSGRYDSPLAESDFRQECVRDIGNLKELEAGLPMAWKKEGLRVDSSSGRVPINLKRLVSKVFFSLEKAALEGLRVNSVRLCQTPSAVWPFRWTEGSRAEDEDHVIFGDYASEEDLEAVNSGETIFFYAPENCQGRLLDGNEDPWAKVPENISGKESLCTYLEVDCSFEDGGFYSGEVLYRMYLGQDSVSDFNVAGNYIMSVQLYLTDGGLLEVSWRVDADVSVNDGFADGWLSKGLHSIDDLYVGERFVYRLVLEEEIMKHLDWNPDRAALVALDDDGNTQDCVLECSGLADFKEADGVWKTEVEVLCRQVGSGTLGLVDGYGNLLTRLDDYLVQLPELHVSDVAESDPGQKVSGLGGPLISPINDDACMLYVFLVDKEGYNLNSSQAYGFESSLFDISFSGTDMPDDVDAAFKVQKESGNSGDDGPVASFSVESVNPGTSDDTNMGILHFMSETNLGNLLFAESNYSMCREVETQLSYLPISLVLVDNGWAGYADCQLSMKVANPSNLPIEVQCWQVNGSKNEYNAISRNSIVNKYGVEFITERYDFISGEFPSGQNPFYVSCDGFRSERNRMGDPYVEDGDWMVYPLAGLSTSCISNALLYDYLTQNSLHHHVEAVFADGSEIYNVDVADMLSDGSMTYNIIYGNDPDYGGWNDKGVWVYTAGRMLSSGSSGSEILSWMNPSSLTDMGSGQMGEVVVSFNTSTNDLQAKVSSAFLDGLLLNVSVSISASGYVQTTPNGTWGKKVDNYCTANVAKTVSQVRLSTGYVNIDGSAVKEAMNAIYAQTYYDSYNKIGSSKSYYHSAHPTSLKIALKFSTGGDYSGRGVPVSVTLPSAISFHHAQENVNYSVSTAFDCAKYRIGFVDNLLSE